MISLFQQEGTPNKLFIVSDPHGDKVAIVSFLKDGMKTVAVYLTNISAIEPQSEYRVIVGATMDSISRHGSVYQWELKALNVLNQYPIPSQ